MTSKKHTNKRETADWIAAALVFVIGAPLVGFGVIAFIGGERERAVSPVRAMLGAQAYASWQRGEEQPQHYLGNDRTAPDFELPMADGSTWRLSDHRGRVVVLNFWTVTCQPCMEEMPSLLELSQILEGRDDIELVTISVDTDWDTAHSAVPANSSMTVLLDPEREVVNGQFGTRLFPETWVIDGDGVIRLRVDGRQDWSSALALDVFETYL